MMNMRTKTTVMGLGLPLPRHTAGDGACGGGGRESVKENCEMRPGGMLVQTRCSSDQNRPPPPTIRVRVKYGSVYHEINISSQATFGELKKMLTGPTGLRHEDQKLFFKDKERDSKAFLDTAGVKNKSKIVLIEDSISQEKRYLEVRRTAKLEKASKSLSDISLEVDRLGGQVAGLESVISRGGKVAENYLVNLIGLLMDQLVKLDGMALNVDAKVHTQRKIQVRRVQNYVETLDMLKVKNSMPNGDGNGNATSVQEKSSPSNQQERRFSDEHSSPLQKQQVRNPFGEPNQPHQAEVQQSQSLPYEHLSSPVGAPKQQPSRHSHELVSSQVQPPQQLLQPERRSASEPVIITTQWETFDSLPLHIPNPPSPFTASTSSSSGASQPAAFSWDLL